MQIWQSNGAGLTNKAYLNSTLINAWCVRSEAMQYEQVDNALMFLEENSSILLQVPYSMDIALVRKYVIEKLGRPSVLRERELIYPENRRVVFESVVGRDTCGLGFDWGRIFFIDRAHDRDYYREFE